MAMHPASDVAFTPTVKALQAAKGSRELYEAIERRGGWRSTVDGRLRAALAGTRSAFLATASADGQPYIQHRGGPAGFIKVLDETTLGFADFTGNQQYISMGNAAENRKAHLFLINYARRQRIKIWGELSVVEDDPELIARVTPPEVEAGVYRARVERAFVLRITAWDINCPQHIPQHFEAEDVAQAVTVRDERIAALEGEIAVLREKLWLKEGCAGAGDD
ncbi:pyridoxamine 5'-phosphate oxidase family protein [Acuticoccus sp. M5D2P5]|uniref:pyridoxamine 5'-phosphate oxidase family protein n=1 Tax=Acuticoccus kalidii TaxID=2910977 RepID=UPI001F400339|nr:pyridoxamine 5'-phosphate oxidase family protein [Acuticoccus kalidii]MCF3934923.1 pyridoxamine 5'-phosphate oxidase family protein [Acuticoccus kalidii]